MLDAISSVPGTVLTSSERSARAVVDAVYAGRRTAGLEAWATPAIFSWDSWVKEQWLERERSGLMLLNSLQEHALWVKVIRASRAGESLLHLDRLASAAAQASRLLADFSPASLQSSVRSGWIGDPAIFSAWLTDFEKLCQREGCVSPSRLVRQLTRFLGGEQETDRAENYDPPLGSISRSPLLLIGFDRLLASQTDLLNAWGPWQLEQADPDEAQEDILPPSERGSRFYAAQHSDSELGACCNWLQARLSANPSARLLVVSPVLQQRRGELERKLLDTRGVDGSQLAFEFSLGLPLSSIAVARSALLLLRWLAGPLSESEIDWLLTSGHSAASLREEVALAEAMREVRTSGLERPEWTLEEFIAVGRGRSRTPDSLENFGSSRHRQEHPLPENWMERLGEAQSQLMAAPKQRSPLEWVRFAETLLEVLGWPGFRPESSIAFQARERWQTMLESCGSLGFDGSEMEWAEFVAALEFAASATIFAAESTNAPVQITEPLESAGQLADGIWFLGAEEEQWPARGTQHSLLPLGLQRETAMPHSSPAADWKLAQDVTERLLGSAREVVFSYARLSGEMEARPSRLVLQALHLQRSGNESVKELPKDFCEKIPAGTDSKANPLTECFEDWSQIGFPLAAIDGGSAVLTNQSLCPFKAFATSRLAAEQWEPAQAGLNARQRGILLHNVMHRVWSGSAHGGISSLDELQGISDLRSFVRPLVEQEIDVNSREDTAHPRFGARFPKRFLKLEITRLTRLVSEWLAYEQGRLPFRIAQIETKSEITIAGLKLRLRLDRVDELPDGSRLIIDYKSSDVGPSAWSGDRPDDVQLPLYATFAMEESLEGLLFARIKPNNTEFCGKAFHANTTLLPSLKKTNGLVAKPLTELQLDQWREQIEQLGLDYLAGRAEVDPKDLSKTCERCHLHSVCRIAESRPLALALEGTDEEETEPEAGSEADVA